jgi:hypothetical protein
MTLYLDQYIEQLQKLPTKTEVMQEAILLIPSPGMVQKDIKDFIKRVSLLDCASRTINKYMKEEPKSDDHYNLIARRIAVLFSIKEYAASCERVMWKEDGGHFYLASPAAILDIRYDDEYIATLPKET